MTVETLRKDLYLYNEATGFVLTSEGLSGRSAEEFANQNEEHWQASIQDGSIIPIQLVQDDELVLRVLVNEPLNEEEEKEWVDRFVWKLSIPNGKFVMAAGVEYLWGEEVEDAMLRKIDVAPGTYQVEVYTYLHGVNGDYTIAGAGVPDEEALVAFWNETRPGEKMPDWFAYLADEEPDEEEDEDETEDDEESGSMGLIDFLIRLTPLQQEPQLPKLDDGWFSITQNPRKPERAPDGIYASRR